MQDKPVVMLYRTEANGVILFVVILGALFLFGLLTWGWAALAGLASYIWVVWRKAQLRAEITPEERERILDQAYRETGEDRPL